MYESTLVKIPSFWYGLKRPACRGRENTSPAANADATSSPRTRARGSCLRAPRDVCTDMIEPPGGAASLEQERASAASRTPTPARPRQDGGQRQAEPAGGARPA